MASKKTSVVMLDVLKGVVEDAPRVLTEQGAPVIPRDLPNARKWVRTAIAEGLLVPVGRDKQQRWRLTPEAQVMLDAHLESGKSAKGPEITGTNLFVLNELIEQNPGLRTERGTPIRIPAVSMPHARRLLQLGALEVVPETRGHIRVTVKGKTLLAEEEARLERARIGWARARHPQPPELNFFTDEGLEDFLAIRVAGAMPVDPWRPQEEAWSPFGVVPAVLPWPVLPVEYGLVPISDVKAIDELSGKGWIERKGGTSTISTTRGVLTPGTYRELTVEGYDALHRGRERMRQRSKGKSWGRRR